MVDLRDTMERWDDIWWNFDEPLTLNPSLGLPIPGTSLRGLTLTTDPVMVVFYRVDDSERVITLVGVLEGW